MSKIDNNIEHDLEVMQVVEKNLDAQKHDAIFCLVCIMGLSNIWIMVVALWEYLGRPSKPELLTLTVEIISVVVMILVLRNTKMKITDFGLKVNDMKKTLIRAFSISLICVVMLVLVKFIFYPNEKLLNWSCFDYNYFLTSIFQEFICRGAMLTILVKINDSRYAKIIGLVSSSFLFSSLHIYYGFEFMLGAALLSFFLGYIYLKDRNIVGVSIIHWIIGSAVFVLELF